MTTITSRTRILAGAAVVWICVYLAPVACADGLVQTPAADQPGPACRQIDAVERAIGGGWCPGYSAHGQSAPASESAAVPAEVLAAILLIPPPTDIVVDIPTAAPADTHPIVVGGPDLVIHTVPGGVNGQAIQSQSAPEPTSLLLAASGAGLAAAGAWYRRRIARRAKDLPAAEIAAA
jgi:hypothetical protein